MVKVKKLNKDLIQYNKFLNYFNKNTYFDKYLTQQKESFNNKNIYNKIFNKRKILKKNIFEAIIYINVNKENTRILLLSSTGQILFNCSSGHVGLKKAQRKKTYGIKTLMQFFLSKIVKYKFSNFILCINGFGRGRRMALKLLSGSKLRKKCSFICDMTRVPHNGTRSRKKPRI